MRWPGRSRARRLLVTWTSGSGYPLRCCKVNTFKGPAVHWDLRVWGAFCRTVLAHTLTHTLRSGLHLCRSYKKRGNPPPSCLQKLKQKNQQLKQIMDQLRNLIWEINSMLAIRSWDATAQRKVRRTGRGHCQQVTTHHLRTRELRGFTPSEGTESTGSCWRWHNIFCVASKHLLILEVCEFLNT